MNVKGCIFTISRGKLFFQQLEKYDEWRKKMKGERKRKKKKEKKAKRGRRGNNVLREKKIYNFPQFGQYFGRKI